MPDQKFWDLLAKKITGEATVEEIRELEEVMRLHPECHYAAQHIQDIWGLSIRENPAAAEDAYLRHLNRMRKVGIAPPVQEDERINLIPHHPNRKKRKVLFASLFSLMGIALVLFMIPARKNQQSPTQKTSEVSTRMGSRSKLLLPDGSSVWLNAGSKLTYNKDFGITSREVTLVGEAFFDVTHMPEMPFVIETAAMQVKVLGTTFNVKAYPNETTSETSVIKGRVEIIPRERPGEKFVLKPNEKLVLSNVQNNNEKQPQTKAPLVLLSSVTYSHKDSAVVETSWVENKLVFDDESFEEVALKMERWYAITIIFKEKKLERMHLTGTFVNESVLDALTALQLTSNFHYQVNQNIVTISE
jgi:transmembrane sensor